MFDTKHKWAKSKNEVTGILDWQVSSGSLDYSLSLSKKSLHCSLSERIK